MMNMQRLLNQVMGSSAASGSSGNRSFMRGIPGGLAGTAAAGGVAAMLLGNKKARKMVAKAATVGGGVLLGGLAYSAFKNWQQKSLSSAPSSLNIEASISEDSFNKAATSDGSFQLTLIKAMIAAAKSDGHIDESEQERIFEAVDSMLLTDDEKAMVLDLLRYPATVRELASGVNTMEQKSELYLISCFAIEKDQQQEQEHLHSLEQALQLPPGLAAQLEQQVVNQAA